MWMWKGPISFKVSCCIVIATFLLCSPVKRFEQELFFFLLYEENRQCVMIISCMIFVCKELERLENCTCNRKGAVLCAGIIDKN